MTVLATTIASGRIDCAVFDPDCFNWTLDEQQALARDLGIRAFRHHVAKCDAYARYVERTAARFALDPANPRTFPPIPTAAFKRLRALSIPEEEVERWSRSSGTSGLHSLVGRSRTSIERLLGSVQAGLTLMPGWSEEELDVIHLGPGYEEAQDIWFPYVMSLTELIYPTVHCMRQGRLDLELAWIALRTSVSQGKAVGLIGAPFAVLECAENFAQRSVEKLGAEIHVVTGGGWKRLSGAALSPPAFREQICGLLRLATESQVRDAFNQVELNSVIFECAAHRKHVPPWVTAFTRDPQTLEPLPDAAPGLFSFVDASAESYPCIIVSDDLGTIRRGPCTCGRDAVTLEFIRRVERGGRQGCAFELETSRQ
ncbi:LuxE/PaaK family acyltransferase [Bradyrhizobium sp.]